MKGIDQESTEKTHSGDSGESHKEAQPSFHLSGAGGNVEALPGNDRERCFLETGNSTWKACET